MSVFSFFECLVDRHDPQRRKVSWDGYRYVGHCRHCGAAIQRHGHHDWRKSDEE